MLSKNCNELETCLFRVFNKNRQKVKIIERKVSYVKEMVTRGEEKKILQRKEKKKERRIIYREKKDESNSLFYFSLGVIILT